MHGCASGGFTYGTGGSAGPARQALSVTAPGTQFDTVLEGRNSASYVQLWLDTAYGPTVGGAMNDAVANLFAGQGTPQDVVDQMTAAAATL